MLGPLFELGTARVAIVEFDSHVELTRNFTKDEVWFRRRPDQSAAGRRRGRRSSTPSPIRSICSRNEPEGRQRVLLLISETRDHGSKGKIEDAVAAVGQANTIMYALAFSPALSNILDTGRGTNKNEMHPTVDFLDLAYRTAQAMRKNVPSTITSMTGGEYELFATRKKFEVRMNDFTNHLHSRYLLSFAPKDPRPGLHQFASRLKERSKVHGAGSNQLLGRGCDKKDADKN